MRAHQGLLPTQGVAATDPPGLLPVSRPPSGIPDQAALRGIPTPCRNRKTPVQMQPTAPSEDTDSEVEDLPNDEEVAGSAPDAELDHLFDRTLLREASQREDFSGYAVAAAMLEVLFGSLPARHHCPTDRLAIGRPADPGDPQPFDHWFYKPWLLACRLPDICSVLRRLDSIGSTPGSVLCNASGLG